MSMKEDFTFQQLAQIALGGSKLDGLQISLLHTIINSALKKLNCENEKVTLSGPPAENLKKLLRKSTLGPVLVFEDRNIRTPMKHYEKLTKLEEKVKNLESQLDKHLAGVNFSLASEPPCWTECDVEEQKDETINALRLSDWFLSQLNQRLSTPLMCQINKIESKLNKLKVEIEEFKKECETTYEEINVVDILQEDLASLREAIQAHQSDFDASMAEIQGLLNFKENNCDILPVKESIREIINAAMNAAMEFKKTTTTPKALTFYSTAELGDSPDKQKSTKLLSRKSGKGACDCENVLSQDQIPLPERIKNMNLNELMHRNTTRFSVFGNIFGN